MKDLQLSLNQTQKVRLQRALEKLESLSSKPNSNASVTVADSIPVNYEDGLLKGHGTSEVNGEVVATVCGVVERVNKLVYVRFLRARYKPEVGDIIVGRVIEVAPKRWRVEINYSHDAVLMLSSMNLPDGIQRRRTALDELNMRTIFEENDVICAEVRGFQHGGLHLQARSRKYGKLGRGQLLTVPSYLVKRRKQHFHHLENYGIDLILGCNGFIWVGEHVEVTDDMVVDHKSEQDETAGSTLRARYKPEVGDIIVGRVIEVAPKRWRVEINYSHDAVLMLSSMNLPDGIQRRRTALDELNMRSIFEENDVICAEVRGFQHDGLHLQARSQKYGKLGRGQLFTVPSYLVKRRKQHFHHLENYGIDLILGCNGFIWVGEHVEVTDDMVVDHKSEQDGIKTDKNSFSPEDQEKNYTPQQTRESVCRTANAIRVLSTLGFNITVEVIMETVDLSSSINVAIHEMLGAEFCVLVAEKEAVRRSMTKKK